MDDSVGTFLRSAHLKALRSELLLCLNESYPDLQHSDMLYLKIAERNDSSIREVVRELQYLAEKGLVTMQQIVVDRYLVRLTAKGRDFLEGSIDVPGLCTLTARSS